jgi:hypothetical protein
MRFLKVLTIAMGVLIVLATAVLVVVIARRIGGGANPPASFAVLLDEPAGTRIAGIAPAADRLAVRLEGGGADRVVLIDPHTGALVGRIALHMP